jgi:hypothetical protein
MPPPIFAHLGHWYVSLPVFMGPVLLLVVALKIQTWREGRPEAQRPRRRSRVTVTHAPSSTTVALAGVLDYPTVLELEIELGEAVRRVDEQGPPGSRPRRRRRTGLCTRDLVLDLRDCTAADTESAWCLCDALARTYDRECVSTLVNVHPATRALREAFCAEGLAIVQAPAADRV